MAPACSARGLRVGQDHHHAKLTDAEVELVRDLREAGWRYADLAAKFEVSTSCVAMICRYERRACIGPHWGPARC